MMSEKLTLRQVEDTHDRALVELHQSSEGRVDPATSTSHPDHWLVEVPGYVMSDLAEGATSHAQDIVRFWLGRVTPDGRAPHMVMGDSWRQRHIGSRVQLASKLENGALVSPFSGPPVLSSCALRIAETLPEDQRVGWAKEVLPKLTLVKQYQYDERVLFGDGLPVQIHPDEVLLRHGRVSDAVLADLPDSKLTDFEQFARNVNPLQRIARGYRRWQGTGGSHEHTGGNNTDTYDSADFMGLDTASRIYTLLATTRRNGFSARRLTESTGRGNVPDGYIVQDTAITGMMLADNQALTELARLAGQELPTNIIHSMSKTEEGVAQLWDESAGKFAARTPKNESLLSNETGIESYLMLLSLGSAALQEVHIDRLVQAALSTDQSALSLPTATVRNQQEAGLIDRGGFSPQINVLLHQALGSYEGHREAAALRARIGISIVAAHVDSGVFSRQYNSITGEPIGQGIWRPTAAAALVVSTELLS